MRVVYVLALLLAGAVAQDTPKAVVKVDPTVTEAAGTPESVAAQLDALRQRLNNVEAFAADAGVSVFNFDLAMFAAAAAYPLSPSVLGQASVDAVNAMRSACAPDVDALCAGVRTAQSDLIADRAEANVDAAQCLAAHQSRVHDACLNAAHAVHTAMRATPSLRQKIGSVAIQVSYAALANSCAAEVANTCANFPSVAPSVPDMEATADNTAARPGPFRRLLSHVAATAANHAKKHGGKHAKHHSSKHAHHRRLHGGRHHDDDRHDDDRHHDDTWRAAPPAAAPAAAGPVAVLRTCAAALADMSVSPMCAAAADNYARVDSHVFPRAPRSWRHGHMPWEGQDDDADEEEYRWHGRRHHAHFGGVVVLLAVAALVTVCCIRRRRRKLRALMRNRFHGAGRVGGDTLAEHAAPATARPSPPTRHASGAEAENDTLLSPQAPVTGVAVPLVHAPSGVVQGTPVYPTYTDYDRN